MIQQLHIQDSALFGTIKLEFPQGFCVFSGPSGSGKSILMESLLACFGLKEPNAGMIEVTLMLPEHLIGIFTEGLGIDEEVLHIKIIKKEKSRYFVNATPIAKKHLQHMLYRIIQYIHSRGGDELEGANLLALLDMITCANNDAHKGELEALKHDVSTLETLHKELAQLQRNQLEQEQRKEMAQFTINSIEGINPKIGEYEALLETKKSLSRKEKLLEAIAHARIPLESSSTLLSALTMLNKHELHATLAEALNDAQALLEEEQSKLELLDEQGSEQLLERIQKLSHLIHRYGSIENALEVLEKERALLRLCENTHEQIASLEARIHELEASLHHRAMQVSNARKKALPLFHNDLSRLCARLKLNALESSLDTAPLSASGCDVLRLSLQGSMISTLSAGEFNRLRLAVMCLVARKQHKQGVLILDEIDANLSGEESEGVAIVLQELSQSYQVFAISHQPHMPSLANAHYLVTRQDAKSNARLLDKAGRIEEIARMVSGIEVTTEAMEFAKKKLEHV